MIKTTYYCNLCGEKRPKDELLQLYWKSSIIPQRYVLEDINPLNGCDKHICKDCVEIIKNHD